MNVPLLHGWTRRSSPRGPEWRRLLGALLVAAVLAALSRPLVCSSRCESPVGPGVKEPVADEATARSPMGRGGGR